ncbi:MAG: phosphoribosyltransferase [Sphingobacteriaceae bacterium]|nr:phosphoribosyltransferase [Sphingobacteriaceae bacterium]
MNQILGPEQVSQKIRRLAYQIWESNYDEPRILLAGVKNRGLDLAELLAAELRRISPLQVEVTYIRLNKDNPVHDEITTGVNTADWQDGTVVVVDDVAHTGRTLLYALKPFMGHLYKRLQIAVLVDRAHKTYPVHADFKGLQLATTLQDRVQIAFEADGVHVYLD